MAANAVVGLASDQAYFDDNMAATTASLSPAEIAKKYEEERSKRQKESDALKGNEQYVEASNEQYGHFQEDPFIPDHGIKNIKDMFPEDRCEMLIMGAGLGGLQYAIHMVQQAGISPKNLRIIDTAGGFGGTWYHNRYPGIMCDVESYCYLPLLEETGYVPKHKYSYGEEIREYAELLAKKYDIADSAVFLTKADKLTWDEESKEWVVELTQRKKGESPVSTTIRSTFVASTSGVLNWLKLPAIPNILDYKGDVFHCARWNYSLTGGSPSDWTLSKLKDKRVAIVGTGASAVQAVPHLAKWSKHLYVVQRTPSSIDYRGQKPTDEEHFNNNIANSKGWQRERIRNLHQHITSGKKPDVNLVDDQWTRSVVLPFLGDPAGPKTPQELQEYLQALAAMDIPNRNAVRERAMQEVKNPDTAQKLQAWYPTWCKRPTFHDDYLATFNRDNVTLLDTQGRNPDRLTSNAIVVDGQEYPVDVIVFATGFRGPFGGTYAEKANLSITGLNGKTMTELWAQQGPSTLHGILDHNFPNLFLSGPWQAPLSASFLFNIGELGRHSAYVLREAKAKAADKPFTVRPTAEAIQAWGDQVAMHSLPTAGIMGCTPGYFNIEGALDRIPAEAQGIMARSGIWGAGMESYLDVIEDWRKEGGMQGIEVAY